MFLILTVLAVIIAAIHGKRQHEDYTTSIPKRDEKPITILLSDPDVESTFKSINEKWIKKPIWDYGMGLEALIEAVIRNRTQADFKIYRRMEFPKAERNNTTMVEKVKQLLGPVCPSYMGRKFSMLGCIYGKFKVPCSIPKFSHYACNGYFDTRGEDDVLTVACLYKTKREKSRRHMYKNIEI